MIKLREAPVNKAQLPLLVVDHHVVRLDVAVHDAIRVTVVQRLQELEYVIPNVVVGQRGVQDFEVRVVHVLEDQARRLRLRVADDVEQLDDVRPAAHVLQYLYLAFDLLLLDGLQDLDHAFGVVRDVDPLEHLGVLPASNFAYDLIVLLIPPIHRQGLVVPVVSGTVDINIGVHSELQLFFAIGLREAKKDPAEWVAPVCEVCVVQDEIFRQLRSQPSPPRRQIVLREPTYLALDMIYLFDVCLAAARCC